MKIALADLRRIIREEIETSDDMAGILARVRAHRERQATLHAAEEPVAPGGGDLGIEDLDANYPGAIDSHPDPGSHRFWDEGGSLNSVSRKMGHRSRMIFGKDGGWHKYYNDARPETVDRRGR